MLARNTSAVANLVVPEEANAVYLHRIGARNHPIPVGGSVRLHAAAAGKAILAYRSEDAVDEYVTRHGLDQKTNRTVTDLATLRSELRSIRDRNIAFDRGELDENWQCVASPYRRRRRLRRRSQRLRTVRRDARETTGGGHGRARLQRRKDDRTRAIVTRRGRTRHGSF